MNDEQNLIVDTVRNFLECEICAQKKNGGKNARSAQIARDEIGFLVANALTRENC